MVLLLRMLSGSRLYGTSHVNSDFDWYEVHDTGKPFHRAHSPEGDLTRWPLSMFMAVAAKGGHNALDLMFAPPEWPVVDLLGPLRASYRANPYECEKHFYRAAESFLRRGDEKGRMHAVRVLDNLSSVWQTGRYNPRWKE